jgi:uncharacterized protein (DUF305 family)
MLPSIPRLVAGGLVVLTAACAPSAATPAPRTAAAPQSDAAPASPTAPAAMADMAHHHHMPDAPPIVIKPGSLITEADVRFMQGMIAHHAQAVHMTRMADAAGASARVLKLAQKIDLSQAGEIQLMQQWLHEYEQFVPDTSSWRGMSMPGMLTAADLAQLEQARGTAFDRLFLTLMIRHHEGALTMVADLLRSPRAAQEVDINVLANEVETSQTAEIGLMQQMLAELP